MFSFMDFPVWANLLIFGIAGGIVWLAGTRVSRYADGISDKTGVGKAFIGLLLLALATETPEIGTTVTASIGGNSTLAINNIFGGVVTQTVMIAVVDILMVKHLALTHFQLRPVLLLQGTLLIILLALALIGGIVGVIFPVWHIGIWSIVLLVSYVFALRLSQGYEENPRWKPIDGEEITPETGKSYPEKSVRELGIYFAVGSVIIFFSGVVLARVSEAIAAQTFLETGFVGGAMLALATSLPELSTTIEAARLKNYSMAVSNIFGSNLIMVVLVFVSDVFYTEGPILEHVAPASLATVGMGIVVTGVYLVGMLERRDRTIWRMGVDSAFVLVLYFVNLGILYALE
jgi:cation:H+ antiporter